MHPARPQGRPEINGGSGRNRTGVHGFAGRCMTTLPPSHKQKTINPEPARVHTTNKYQTETFHHSGEKFRRTV